jgi:hypothetical protein
VIYIQGFDLKRVRPLSRGRTLFLFSSQKKDLTPELDDKFPGSTSLLITQALKVIDNTPVTY